VATGKCLRHQASLKDRGHHIAQRVLHQPVFEVQCRNKPSLGFVDGELAVRADAITTLQQFLLHAQQVCLGVLLELQIAKRALFSASRFFKGAAQVVNAGNFAD